MDPSREETAALEDESFGSNALISAEARTFAKISTDEAILKHGSAESEWVKKILRTVIQAPFFLYYAGGVEEVETLNPPTNS